MSFLCMLTRLILLIAPSMSYASVSIHLKKRAPDELQRSWNSPIAALVTHPCSAQGYRGGVAQMFIASRCPLHDDAAYEIAFTIPGAPELCPLLTETKMIVNNVTDQPHPVRGHGCAYMSLLGINPVVVPADNLSLLTLLNITTEPHRALTLVLSDAQNNLAAACGLATLQNPGHIPDVIVVAPNMTIAVPVRPCNGTFGDPGSGVSIMMTAIARPVSDTEKDTKLPDAPRPEDLVCGVLGVLPLDRTSTLLGLGGPVSTLSDAITIHAAEWIGRRHNPDTVTADVTVSKVDSLGKFFIGIDTRSGQQEGDAATAVLIAQTVRMPDQPVFALMNALVTATALGTDAIIAARTTQGGPARVVAHALRTVRTTTGLDYLIVHGGPGTDEVTKRSVYALPILRESGMLAHVHAHPVTTYYPSGSSSVPAQRFFATLPMTPADLYTSQSTPARVGGGMAPGIITDIHISGDAVYVAITDPDHAGIWHSQAIFDTRGVISAWTPWRPTGGTQGNSIVSLARDEHAGTWCMVTQSPHHTPALSMTQWNATSSLAQALNMVSGKRGTLHYVCDIPRTTSRPGWLIGAGGISTEETPFVALFTTDTLAAAVQHKVNMSHPAVVWSAETLPPIGTVQAASVIADATQEWLILGGSHGIAILMRPDSTGWALHKTTPNDAVRFEGMRWQRISFGHHPLAVDAIKKLVTHEGKLYVLTAQELLRIDIGNRFEPHKPLIPAVVATRTAVTSVKNSIFTDLFIQGPLALLATSVGCFRTGDGASIASTTQQDMHWTKIILPYSPGPVLQLFPIGPVVHDHHNYDANIYALSASSSSSQARVYRLAVHVDRTVTPRSVMLLPDEISEGVPGFLLSIGDYRSHLATDGAFLCSVHNTYGGKPSTVELLDPDWRLWPSHITKSLTIIRGAYRGVAPKQTTHVYGIHYCNGLGTWIVLTDAGVVVHE